MFKRTPRPATNIYGLVNLFSGGALLQLTVFALGIMPYITASIILQLLTVVIPRLEALKKEGQAGQSEDHAVHPLPDDRLSAILQSHRRHRAGPLRAALPQLPADVLLVPTTSIFTIVTMVIMHDRRHGRDHVAG